MGTINQPSQYDCASKLLPDEPNFLLLGRDKCAPVVVWLWAVLREIHAREKPNPDAEREQALEARQIVIDMFNWQEAHDKLTVGVGEAALAAVFELIRAANAGLRNLPNTATGQDQLKRFFLHSTNYEDAEKVLPATQQAAQQDRAWELLVKLVGQISQAPDLIDEDGNDFKMNKAYLDAIDYIGAAQNQARQHG